MFVFFNPNPGAKRVGDCAVRAIAKAMGTDWEKAGMMTIAADITAAPTKTSTLSQSSRICSKPQAARASTWR